MNKIEDLVSRITWAGRNMAYNLEFTPKEKLAWQPAKTANSTLDVVNHAVSSVYFTLDLLTGQPSDRPTAHNKKEAQALILDSVKAYETAIKKLTTADLEKKLKLSWGDEWTALRAIELPATDMLHHHGQVTYIQTILGDKESHFVPDDWQP